MMKFLREKLRSASFWVALSGALTLILSRLGYSDSASLTQNIVDGLASVLLVFGIATSPVRDKTDGDTAEETTEESAERSDEENREDK